MEINLREIATATMVLFAVIESLEIFPSLLICEQSLAIFSLEKPLWFRL